MSDDLSESRGTKTPCLKPPAGWTCSRVAGHDGPCAAARIDPYYIEIDTIGCHTCGLGKTWMVVGPDGCGGGTSYGDKDEAEEIADMLNEAYAKGGSTK